MFYWSTSSSDFEKIDLCDSTDAALVGSCGLGFVLRVSEQEASIPLGGKR